MINYTTRTFRVGTAENGSRKELRPSAFKDPVASTGCLEVGQVISIKANLQEVVAPTTVSASVPSKIVSFTLTISKVPESAVMFRKIKSS